MTFMRSNSGIQNYALFRGATCTVYIEGRVGRPKGANGLDSTYDELFYRALLGLIKPEVKITIKVVGSKKDVLAYAKRINLENLRNSFVIVDKDHEDLTSCILQSEKIVRTYGYSWENDFWTKKICYQIHKDTLASNNAIGQRAFYAKYKKIVHRLARVSQIDALFKTQGLKYIPSTDKSVGLNMDKSVAFGVSARDLKKLNRPMKAQRGVVSNCPIFAMVSQIVVKLKPEMLIRGHLWEHACIHFIGNAYKERSGEKSIPNTLVKNLSFSKFANDPEQYLMRDAFNHYSKVIKKAMDSALAAH